MWLYLVSLVGLWTLLRLIRERQVVSHLQDKHVFITGCDSGFGNLLARQLDRRGMRVLAACLTEKGAEELRNKTSDRLETVILDVTKTESIVAATQWVKERVGNRGIIEISVCVCWFVGCVKGMSALPAMIPDVNGGGIEVAADSGPPQHVSPSSYFSTQSFKLSTLGQLVPCVSSRPHSRLSSSATVWRKTGLLAAECHIRQRLWGLVNNAGISIPSGPNEWLNKEDFAKILNVNLLGVIEVTLSMLPLVRKARGRVVNVSSVMGRVSFFGGGYSISKYGVEAFSDSLRRELSYFGVKVAIVEPGFFWTGASNSDMHLCNAKMLWDRASSEVKEVYGEKFLASHLTELKSLDQKCKEDLSLVTDCMEHALTSRHPRTRYSAGWDAKLFFIPVSYLPTFLADAIFYTASLKPDKAL
ncbi:Retinol dehydrogenase 2 [Microtus ochrogaster]|uniref:Retinol dehydrogenase 2 n=1 Tax=Microtus ochrogaster TaxID=79684 RepID=A0A8J6H0I6_MICOH|nr:Retinol dehydrogenase 2 [Microtus ochrogaster]